MDTKTAGRNCEGLGRCFDAWPFMKRLDGWIDGRRSEGELTAGAGLIGGSLNEP